MIRDDLSTKLIHFTKGIGSKGSREFIKEANERFLHILAGGVLFGSASSIKSGCKCICFSESPISKFPSIFDAKDFPYAPLGVMVDKTWLFQQGGRPVIYQPDSEYKSLSKANKYKHKSYDPIRDIDFTWEREWRIPVDKLLLDDRQTTYIVPNRKLVDSLKKLHAQMTRKELRGSMRYGSGREDNILECVTELRGHFIALEDLGIHIKWC